MRRQQGGQGKLLTLQPLLSSGDRTVQLKQGDSSNKPTAPSFGTYQGVASDTLLHISPGMIICVYLSSRITSTFEDFVFLMAYSSLERPVPGNWSFQNPRLPTIPTHPGTERSSTSSSPRSSASPKFASLPVPSHQTSEHIYSLPGLALVAPQNPSGPSSTTFRNAHESVGAKGGYHPRSSEDRKALESFRITL